MCASRAVAQRLVVLKPAADQPLGRKQGALRVLVTACAARLAVAPPCRSASAHADARRPREPRGQQHCVKSTSLRAVDVRRHASFVAHDLAVLEVVDGK